MESSTHFAALINCYPFEHENILHGHDFAFDSRDFTDRDHLSLAIGKARDLYHGVNGRSDLVPDRPLRNI